MNLAEKAENIQIQKPGAVPNVPDPPLNPENPNPEVAPKSKDFIN